MSDGKKWSYNWELMGEVYAETEEEAIVAVVNKVHEEAITGNAGPIVWEQ